MEPDPADADDEASATPITVVLAHPDETRRALFERQLARARSVEVVGTSSNIVEAMELVIDLVPDVLAIHAGDEIVDAVQRVVWEAPSVAILVLEPGPEDFSALQLGALGALPPGSRELAKAVVGAARGESVLPPEWALGLLEAVQDLGEQVRRRVLLSETEREVLVQIAEGESPLAIANQHEVTERLVNLHIAYAVIKYQRVIETQRALLDHESQQHEHDSQQHEHDSQQESQQDA